MPHPVCPGRAHSPASTAYTLRSVSVSSCLSSGPIYPIMPVCHHHSLHLHRSFSLCLFIWLYHQSVHRLSIHSLSLSRSDSAVDESACLELPFTPQVWGSRQATWSLPT